METDAVFEAGRGRRRGPARGAKTAPRSPARRFAPVKPIAEVTDTHISLGVLV